MRAIGFVAVLAILGCATSNDDESSSCRDTECRAMCLANGFVGGACAAGTCRCQSTDAGDADSDAEDAGGDVVDGASIEPCNSFDDNSDGRVDEGCPCTSGATQTCYPAPAAPSGCTAGSQECLSAGGSTGWGPCEGATVPLEGATACCDALDDPVHPSLELYMAAYPIELIPSDTAVLPSFVPEAGGTRMTEASTAVADEFVDLDRGGVIVENLRAGRDATREAALAVFGVTATDILHQLEPEPTFGGADFACSRWGAAWGSVLYRTGAGAVQEVIYLYVGICNDDRDAEGFYSSEFPTDICEEGSVPLI